MNAGLSGVTTRGSRSKPALMSATASILPNPWPFKAEPRALRRTPFLFADNAPRTAARNRVASVNGSPACLAIAPPAASPRPNPDARYNGPVGGNAIDEGESHVPTTDEFQNARADPPLPPEIQTGPREQSANARGTHAISHPGVNANGIPQHDHHRRPVPHSHRPLLQSGHHRDRWGFDGSRRRHPDRTGNSHTVRGRDDNAVGWVRSRRRHLTDHHRGNAGRHAG